MSERVLVRKIEDNLWQWREASSQGGWATDAYYTGDINLLTETTKGKLVWLILPGQSVVSQYLAADIKDRNQLLKLLPYEIEDNVIDPVEDVHFSFGEIQDDRIQVVYGDLDWLSACVDEIEATGAEVILCSADYLQLPRADSAWTLLLENGIVMALTDEGKGFSIEQEMASLYFHDLLDSAPQKLTLFGDSDESLYALRKLLPESILSQEDIQVSEEQAGLWDLISPSTPFKTNFRTGRLARKLPFAKWWEDYKVPIVAMAAAFVLALTTTWFAQSKVVEERKTILAQTDEIYRQVVPNGRITEPKRQLRALLGTSGTSSAEPSNAVSLIAGVGPAISSVKNITVKSFRYTVSKKQLQMNIEGASYDDFETLRGIIADVGLKVEIKNQSAHGDIFQAQMRVSEES